VTGQEGDPQAAHGCTADAHGKNQAERVKFIQARIDWANTVHDHLTKVTSEINTHCAA
jgi:hypothetical protein